MPIMRAVDARAVEQIPTERLAQLIRDARERGDVELALLAAKAGVTQRSLRKWERGRARPSPSELERLAVGLGLEVEELVPPRTPVAYHPGTRTLTVGHRTAAVIAAAEHADDNESILRAYVAAVAAARGRESTQGLALRADDIDALAQLLDLDDTELQGRLAAILGVSVDAAADAHRRLLSRRAATVAAALSVGVLTSFPLSTAAAVQTTTPYPSTTPQTNVTTVPASSITSGGSTGSAVLTTTTFVPTPAPTQQIVVPAAAPTPPPAPPAPAPHHATRHAPEHTAAPAAPTTPSTSPHQQLPNDADGDGVDIGTALVIERAPQSSDPNTQLGDVYTESR